MGKGLGTILGGAAGAGLAAATGGTSLLVGGALGAGLGMSLDAGADAAAAQGDIAQAQLAQQRADRALALQYAEPSPEEVAQLNKSISLNEADIARKTKLIESSDPALIEAGQQALKLLRGEEAKTLGPLKNNIAKQEQKLRERLQAQLGPGWETSTAGQQALAAFNEQASGAIAGAQQATLGQLLGVAQDTSGRYGMQSNIANAGTIGQAFGNINNRRISAINATPVTNAGAQFVGDLQSARNTQQTIGQVAKIGGMMYSAGAFGGADSVDSAKESASYFGGGGSKIPGMMS